MARIDLTSPPFAAKGLLYKLKHKKIRSNFYKQNYNSYSKY